MNTQVQYQSYFEEDNKLLISRLSGTITISDIEAWEKELMEALTGISGSARFKAIFDLNGYEPSDIDSHKVFREIIPSTLLRLGFMPGYVALFDQKDVKLNIASEQRCIAVAHVHHDHTKMDDYQSRFGSESERFFYDSTLAEAWIRGVVV